MFRCDNNLLFQQQGSIRLTGRNPHFLAFRGRRLLASTLADVADQA
jgi:hypothetical protein